MKDYPKFLKAQRSDDMLIQVNMNFGGEFGGEKGIFIYKMCKVPVSPFYF